MRQYTVDAFTNTIFSGNPAAVCILDKWLPDELMINIACENNLSETAFAVRITQNHYHLRWFTPTAEIGLCGHATLATAFVIFQYYAPSSDILTFDTLSGELSVVQNKGRYEMTFPSYQLASVPVTNLMQEVIGTRPIEALIGRDLLCITPDNIDLAGLTPDFDKMAKLDGLLLHVTQKGNDYDCISRRFVLTPKSWTINYCKDLVLYCTGLSPFNFVLIRLLLS